MLTTGKTYHGCEIIMLAVYEDSGASAAVFKRADQTYVWPTNQLEESGFVVRPAASGAPPVPPAPAVGEVWRHYKGGRYDVLAVVTNADLSGFSVVYRNRDKPDGNTWVRTLTSWNLRVLMQHDSSVPRFTREP